MCVGFKLFVLYLELLKELFRDTWHFSMKGTKHVTKTVSSIVHYVNRLYIHCTKYTM